MCAVTVYLPMSVMPLYIAAFCIFLACRRGGVPHGILCAIATVGIMFAMSGLSVKWLFLAIMFAPYGVITSFAHRYDYFKPKRAVLRVLISAVYFNVTLGVIYVLATYVLTAGIDVSFDKWSTAVGGYAVVAVIATAILLPLDFIFSTLSIFVLKRLPDSDKEKKPPISPENGNADIAATAVDTDKPAADAPENKTDDGKKYDIFGYEIKDDDGKDNTQ